MARALERLARYSVQRAGRTGWTVDGETYLARDQAEERRRELGKGTVAERDRGKVRVTDGRDDRFGRDERERVRVDREGRE